MTHGPPGTVHSSPSATAEWRIADAVTRRLHLLPGTRLGCVHVLGEPALARAGQQGRAAAGLTLLLDRQPGGDDLSLVPRVVGGVVVISASVSPTQDELAFVAEEPGDDDVRVTATRIFERSTVWRLIGTDGGTLAEVTVEGPGSATAMSVGLSRDDALSVLYAFEGTATGAALRCDVEFRAETADGQSVPRTLSLTRPLHTLLQLDDGTPLDAVVSAVCPADGGGFRPVTPRMQGSAPVSRAASKGPAAFLGASRVAMAAVLRTSVGARLDAHVLASSDLAIQPARLGHRWQVNDLVIAVASQGESLQHLPQVDDAAGGTELWPDRASPDEYFYAPELTVIDPDPHGDVATSPFAFSFRTLGHDEHGLPGLEGSIRVSLKVGMSDATTAVWEANGSPTATPVPLGGLSVSIVIPFRSAGTTEEQAIRATDVQQDGDTVVATFDLTDQWARFAYGALARAGYQDRPIRLTLSYAFSAYVPIETDDDRISWGGKIAFLNRIQADGLVVRGATTRDAPVVVDSREVPAFAATRLTAHPASALALHALLVEPVAVAPPRTYGLRTLGRSVTVDALFPCNTLGSLYVQASVASDGVTPTTTAIGCRDAWTLGQGTLALYEPEAVDIGVASPPFSLLKSLQVPNRFLMLPKAYTITRFEPSDSRAYRPALYLFSSVDAMHPENNSCVVMATLRASITPADRQAAIDALRAKGYANPMLEWPTDLAVEPTYKFAIPQTGSDATRISWSVVRVPEGFQVSLSTGVAGILQLKAIIETGGITGVVDFPLPDGTHVSSNLVIDLGRIDGPWEAGAVTASVGGAGVTLVNCVESDADVSDLLLYSSSTRSGKTAVEAHVPAGASVTVTSPAGVTSALPRYTLAKGAATLEELRTFVEDIYTTIVFVTSLDLIAHQIDHLVVDARMVGVPHTGAATIDAKTTSAEVAFVLPLTTYLAEPTLQYRVTAKKQDASEVAGAWRDWRIDVLGNVVTVDQSAFQEG